MPPRNYTTTIDPDRTITEIRRRLVRFGARQIVSDYAGEDWPVMVSFTLDTPAGPRPFRLPANVEAMHHLLWRGHQAGEIPARYATREHAARVVWRTVREWIEAQLAMVEMELVTADEVFLPYLIVDANRTTLYERMRGANFLLPPPKEG